MAIIQGYIFQKDCELELIVETIGDNGKYETIQNSTSENASLYSWIKKKKVRKKEKAQSM